VQARDKGFKEQLAAKYPDLKLIAEKVADGQAVTGLNIMTDLITANPKLRGVFSDALFIGQGAGQAIAENKAGNKIKLVTFDSDQALVILGTEYAGGAREYSHRSNRRLTPGAQ
jgi:ribose transport system substrate-binding protein